MWRRGSGSRLVRLPLILLAAAALLITMVELGAVVAGPVEPVWFPVGVVLMALTYVATGLLAWYRRPANRIGALLYATGLVWFVTVVDFSGIPWLTAVSRVIALVPLALILHLLLAFPSGRLAGRVEVGLVIGAYVVAFVLEAPKYLLAPEPSGLLQIADAPTVARVMKYVEAAAAAAVIVSVSIVLIGRLRRATPRQRRTLAPLSLLGIATIVFIIVSANVLVPLLGLDPLGLAAMQLVAVALIPVAFTLGVLRGGFARTAEMEDLGVWLGSGDRGSTALRNALRETLGDPSLDLLYWMPSTRGYVDLQGASRPITQTNSGHAAVEILLAGQPVGAITYDATLLADSEPVRAAAAVTAIALERERLTAELAATAAALRESRARVVTTGDLERRRIARDLHDGVQARLTLLTLRLATARRELADSSSACETVEAIGTGLNETINELRRLVHGVMPAVLVERGLFAAVEDLVDQLPLPVSLEVPGTPRPLPSLTESTAYFVVAEGLSNAVKHAHATRVQVRLGPSNGQLEIEVRDDGVGGARLNGLGGIRGIADRLDAVGGRLALDSPLGGGTRLLAEVPCGS